MKLLIADDEPLIRQGLRRMLEDSPLFFDDILEAENGRAAVKLALQHKPEIILMDIKMPGLCGIGAAREINSLGANCRIIFLTAYGRFDFAREAVRCRARDFLVKPVSREDLVKVLAMYGEEIRQDNESRQKEERVKEELFCSLEEFLVRELVAGKLTAEQLWPKLKIISPPEDKTWFSEDRPPNVCLVFSSACRLPGPGRKSISLSGVSFPLLGERIDEKTVYLSSLAGPADRKKEISVDLARVLGEAVCGQSGGPVFIGIGGAYDGIELLPRSYAEALQALESARRMVFRAANEKYKIMHIDNVNEKSRFFRPYQIAQQVIDYLENNYWRKVSLEEAARTVYLNPVYLSAIFKQETGCTFSEYLTLLRVEKAKKLLAAQFSVKEVASKVGYADCNYFCRVFKKVTGITATAYRKSSFTVEAKTTGTAPQIS